MAVYQLSLYLITYAHLLWPSQLHATMQPLIPLVLQPVWQEYYPFYEWLRRNWIYWYEIPDYTSPVAPIAAIIAFLYVLYSLS